jgi:hypothetical protein
MATMLQDLKKLPELPMYTGQAEPTSIHPCMHLGTTAGARALLLCLLSSILSLPPILIPTLTISAAAHL